MSLIANRLTAIFSFFRLSRDQHLSWQLSRQDKVAALRQAKIQEEQLLAAQLKKQAQKLAHELALDKTRNQNELKMLKIQCEQDLKDYQQYLQALDKLKVSLREHYAHLPEAVAFTIHHHAKQLLNNMWGTDDSREKIKMEMQLLEFMTAVHEDTLSVLQSQNGNQLPAKALAYIDADNSQ